MPFCMSRYTHKCALNFYLPNILCTCKQVNSNIADACNTNNKEQTNEKKVGDNIFYEQQ